MLFVFTFDSERYGVLIKDGILIKDVIILNPVFNLLILKMKGSNVWPCFQAVQN